MEQLGGVAALMSSVEGLFSPVIKVARADSQPAISQSLQYVRGEVEKCLSEFTTWKTHLLSLGQQPTGHQPGHSILLSLLTHRLNKPISCRLRV